MSRQRGFSLVELMVALVLGLIVMGAALRLFVGTRGSANLEDQLSRQQEDARYAVEALAMDARQAGFVGCRPGVKRLLNDTADPLLYDIERPIEGFEFTGTGPGANYAVATLDPAGVALNKWSNGTATLPAILKDSVLPGTDVLIVKQAALRQPVRTTLTEQQQPTTNAIELDGDPPDVEEGTLVVLSDCSGADLFQNTVDDDKAHELARSAADPDVSPGNRDAKLSHPYPKGAEVYVFSPSVYYVGQGPRGEPGLYRRRFKKGGAGDAQELVPGVENMQLLFGEDTDVDRLADTYVPADQVGNWGRVVSIKLALLMRTGEDTHPNADTATYTLLGTTIDPPDARRVHRVVSWTIALRNQTR